MFSRPAANSCLTLFVSNVPLAVSELRKLLMALWTVVWSVFPMDLQMVLQAADFAEFPAAIRCSTDEQLVHPVGERVLVIR